MDNLFQSKKQTEGRRKGSREKPAKLEEDQRKSQETPFNPNFCGFSDEDVVLMVSELIREPYVLNLRYKPDENRHPT